MSRGRNKVGVIVPPSYFDLSAREFTELDPTVDVMHTQMRFDAGFGYGLDEIAAAVDEIEACAVSLAEAGADVIVQLGTPFSTIHGWDGAEQVRSRIEASCGVAFEMMGQSVIEAIHAIGAKRVALAAVYYGDEWIERYSEFVTGSGLTISTTQSFTDQGHFPSSEEAFAASFEPLSEELVRASLRQLADEDPDADAILVPGMPGTILPLIPELEREIGRPVISYFAIWWKARRRLGLAPIDGHGALFATT